MADRSIGPRPTAVAVGEHEPDGQMVRRLRWQLIAWSAGSTFVVLLALGALVYAAAAVTLASSAEDLLRDRASLLVRSAPAEIASTPTLGADGMAVVGTAEGAATIVTGDAGLPGFAVDGPYAGTLGLLVVSGATGSLVGPVSSSSVGVSVINGSPADIPDATGLAAAQRGATVLRETTYRGNPVRVLSVPVPGPGLGAAGAPAGVVQVVADRTAELRTLSTLLVVLLGGGLLALAAATAVGAAYATRALVPIRASLQRQREFAADTSHELRTPLAVIRTGVARIRQQPDVRVAEVGPTLDAVDAEAIRLAALVDDLLALARTDAGAAELDLQDINLGDIAADALAALEPLATTRGARLELDVEPAPLRGDPVRLRRLVTVLADNAIRHGREGGHVRVTVRPGRLTVDDDGPGIAPADRERVFDRFWRGSGAAAGGSGLGLAIAAWIVDRHRGRVEVGSSPLGGARFEVFLPVS